MESKLYMPTREAAKGILLTSDGDVLLVAGKSGRLNLPGGGIDEGENAEDALCRELYEEIGLSKENLGNIIPVSCIQGGVTSGSGENFMARWSIFSVTANKRSIDALTPGDDIKDIVKIAPSEIMGYNGHISALARQALCDVLQLDR